jgi:hypothetical protein
MSDELTEEPEVVDPADLGVTESDIPPIPASPVLPASLALAVVVSSPLHLAALRGEGSVPMAAIGFLVAFAGAMVLSALATWMVSAVDGEVPEATGGPEGDDSDRRIMPC